MRLFRRLRVLALLTALAALASLDAYAEAPPNLPAQVVDAAFASEVKSFPSVSFTSGGKALPGKTEWRVVQHTGNCCENYVTSDKKGRIYDFGGSYINYTDDRGKTWKSVRPLTPLVNGEGAIVTAPGGDILGVQWDPYSGDHLLAFKYVAEDDQWLYAEMPVHMPFYDREWISVVPGPIDIGGTTVPYVSFIKGAWPSKEVWFYSTDGLNYDMIDSKYARGLVSGTTKSLKAKPVKDMDWIQPNSNGDMFPLGRGRLLAAPDFPFNGGQDAAWSVFEAEEGAWNTLEKGMRGRVAVDGIGRIHNVFPLDNGFGYRVSTNSGKSWTSLEIDLGKKRVIEEYDIRANRAAGVAAVAIHAFDGKKERDVDLLYKFDITKTKPRLINEYQVGAGDVNGSSGVGASIRFDFETMTILPDGKIVMSFYDTTTVATNGTRIIPWIAIEGRSFRR